MTALSANRNLDRFVDREIREFQVGAAVHIYGGAFVGVDPAGYAKAFEPGDIFVGVAYEEKDNSAGTAGAMNVRVFTEGDFVHALTSAALTHFGQPVYATDDATLALVGHPDAFVGRVVYKHADASGYAVIRLRGLYDHLTVSDRGFVEIATYFGEINQTLATTTGTVYQACGLVYKSIDGAGLPLIDGTAALNAAQKLQFDAVAEVALASIRTRGALFPVSGGITLDVVSHVEDHGDHAALDVDWGLGTALTTNSEADIDHADMVNLAAFHMDGSSDNIYAQSDNDVTDVAPVDTTVDNVETDEAASFKHSKIIIRPAGTAEFWINRARVLSTTSFAVAASAILQAFYNAEKTANDTTFEANLTRFRAAGAQLHAA